MGERQVLRVVYQTPYADQADGAAEVYRHDSFDRLGPERFVVCNGQIYIYYKSAFNRPGNVWICHGLAIGDNPLGPFRKHPLNPIANSGHETTRALKARSEQLQPAVTRVSDSVYCASGYSPANIAMIVGTDGLIVIDTGMFPAHAEQVLAEFRKITDLPVVAVILTHGHGDHTGGRRSPWLVLNANWWPPPEKPRTNSTSGFRLSESSSPATISIDPGPICMQSAEQATAMSNNGSKPSIGCSPRSLFTPFRDTRSL